MGGSVFKPSVMQPHARRHINIEYMQMGPETGLKICKLERTLEIFDFLYNQKQLTAPQTESVKCRSLNSKRFTHR